MIRTRQISVLLLFLLLCFLAAGIGSYFTSTNISNGWYASLPQPSWTPPNWLFGPVWTVLYALMAVTAWQIWRQQGSIRQAIKPLTLFTVQLIVNSSWSGVFFGQRLVGVGFFIIILLWVLILLTLVSFWRIKPLAGILLLPYLLWVSYAATLNFAIWYSLGFAH